MASLVLALTMDTTTCSFTYKERAPQGGAPQNNRMKLTRGEGCSQAGGAHSRAARARGVLSRRAQLMRVFYGRELARA